MIISRQGIDVGNYPVVGITGGVGCGKSEVGRLLTERGVRVVDADEVVHELLRTEAEIRRQLVSRFGTSIENVDGGLNRALLARQVFADVGARRFVEALIHPRVLEHLRQWVREQRTRGPGAVLVPLLFEVNFTEGWDAIWCVSAKPDVVRARVRARGWSDEQLEQRQAAQWPLNEKEQKASLVLLNNGSRDELAAAVRHAWDDVLKRST